MYTSVQIRSPLLFPFSLDLIHSVYQHGGREATKIYVYLTLKVAVQYGLRSVCSFGARCWNIIPMCTKILPRLLVFVLCSKRPSLKTITITDLIKIATKRSPSSLIIISIKEIKFKDCSANSTSASCSVILLMPQDDS